MKRITIVLGVILSAVLGASGAEAGKGWLANAQVSSFVAKVDVSDMNSAIQWYTNNLGLVLDPRFTTSNWAQLNLPNNSQSVAIGLNLNPSRSGSGTGGATATFVVSDIVAESNALISAGINVSPVTNVGDGVCLAFFKDPDSNSLGLRQNNCTLQTAESMGELGQRSQAYPAGNLLILRGTYNKTGNGLYSVQFGETYARPPVVLLTPFWQGQNAQVGNIETLNTVTETGFTGYSLNAGPNYFVEWVAIGTPE